MHNRCHVEYSIQHTIVFFSEVERNKPCCRIYHGAIDEGKHGNNPADNVIQAVIDDSKRLEHNT